MRRIIKFPTLSITDDEMLEDLKFVAKKINKKSISKEEYKKFGKYSYTSFRNHFGTWKQALLQAGLNRSRNWGTSRKEFLENLDEVWVKLGRQPKYSDMIIPLSKFSAASYTHSFGSWTNTLKEFEKYLNEESIETFDTIINVIPDKASGHKTSRYVNWRLRFKVMQRDNFKCVFCGRSPAKDLSIVLHVDHIIPYSKGGETIFENLQTLCSVCNIGKNNEI